MERRASLGRSRCTSPPHPPRSRPPRPLLLSRFPPHSLPILQLCVVHAAVQGEEERRGGRGSMGGRGRKGRCGRRERESGRVGGRAVARENLVGEGLRIEGGSMREEKWEGEETLMLLLRIDQEDTGVMSTNTGRYTLNLQ